MAQLVSMAVLMAFCVLQTPERPIWWSSLGVGLKMLTHLVDRSMYVARPIGLKYVPQNGDFGLVEVDGRWVVVMDWARVTVSGLSQNVSAYELVIAGRTSADGEPLEFELGSRSFEAEPGDDGEFTIRRRFPAAEFLNRQLLVIRAHGPGTVQNISNARRIDFGEITRLELLPVDRINEKADFAVREQRDVEVAMTAPYVRGLLDRDVADAERAARMLLKLDVDSGELNYLFAWILISQGKDYDSAIAHLDAAERASFDPNWTCYVRGAAWMALGDTAGAQRNWSRIDTSHPAFEQARQRMAQLEQSTGVGPEALSPRLPDEREAALAAAMPTVRSQKFDMAMSEFERGDHAAVIRLIESGDCDSMAPRGEAHYLLAFSLLTRGERLDEAILHFDQALAQGSAEFWVRYNRGAAHLRLEHWEQAAIDLYRAIELDPSHEGCRYYLAELRRLTNPAAEEQPLASGPANPTR